MPDDRESRDAFGAPGLEPRWTDAAKDGVGTAYSASSRLWFTLADGIVTEVYCPTVDRAQLRDLQFLVTDGATFVHRETRDTETTTACLAPNVLGYRIENSDRHGRYEIEKTVIADPHYPCLLQRVAFRTSGEWSGRLKLFVLCAPHLEVGGWNNNAHVVEAAGHRMLAAEKDGRWLVVAATRPFARLSCGYVGASDGWTDLADNYQMDWTFDRAENGNVALMAEIGDPEQVFTLGLAIAGSLHSAVTTLLQSLDLSFEKQLERYVEQWTRATHHMLPLDACAGDGGLLASSSFSLLLAHEDKMYPGALIASLSIPWGESKGDEDRGGYHLVWTRDLVNSVAGLIAAGHVATSRRALVYLAASQREDGGFAQNAWIDGEAYWTGIQLDEIAFPILLARRLARENALGAFDPYSMVARGAAYLVRHGPVTDQDRWEEASGYSPSTLANNIAGVIAAACFARERGDEASAAFLEDYADFLERHVEAWTVTTAGELVPGLPRHYIRIRPIRIGDPSPDEDPNAGILDICNTQPGERYEFPAKDIVDAGFLELVRYGIRRPLDPLIVDSLAVVDAVLKVETPLGPCWRRYNHDGYGQREDGGPYEGWGVGRAWPLLTGERGHYELAAGRDPAPYIRALERFASATGLLSEQIWDEDDRPAVRMFRGQPTGAARPLMWAHAEYLKLLRSARDGRTFEQVPEAAARYAQAARSAPAHEIWKANRQARRVAPGARLRIVAERPFRLHWTADEWRTKADVDATRVPLGFSYVDLAVAPGQRAPVRFTFLWTDAGQWEGKDYAVEVAP